MKLKILLFLLLPFLSCQAQESKVDKKTQARSAKKNYTNGRQTIDGTGKYYFGREIAQVMGAAGSDWLERPERQSEENTSLAINKMKLADNAVVADIGAGTGYYTFRIAPIISKGKIYAVEIQDELIRFLDHKKSELKLPNVEVIKGRIDNVNLPANSVDLAFMVDVYHELEFPHEVLKSLYTSLKADGKILLIEYRGEDPSVPIKPLHKTTVLQLNKEMMANGFEPDFRGDFLPIQHYLVYRKIKL